MSTEQAIDATGKSDLGIVKRKRGGQSGNRNAMRHGLCCGRLQKNSKYIEIRISKFRRLLEDAVFAARGHVSISDGALIHTILRWEMHAIKAQRWLVEDEAKLKPMERLHYSREIARASSIRDKSILALELDGEMSLAVLGQSYNRRALPAPNGNQHEE